MNTRILHISGEENSDMVFFNAIESDKISKEQLWEEAHQAGETQVYTDEDGYFEYTAHKFGEIDPGFIDFVLQNFVEDTIYPDMFFVLGVQLKQ